MSGAPSTGGCGASGPGAPAPSGIHWNPYIAGAALGVVLAGAYLLTGHGLGASAGIQRILVASEGALSQDHVARTPHHALLLGAGAGASVLRHWIVWMLLGTAAGGLASGLLAGRVGVTTCRGPRIGTGARWALALAGGALVGYGAAMARGCTSGQALSGGAVLAAGSWAFMMAVFGGGYVLAYFVRRLWI